MLLDTNVPKYKIKKAKKLDLQESLLSSSGPGPGPGPIINSEDQSLRYNPNAPTTHYPPPTFQNL